MNSLFFQPKSQNIVATLILMRQNVFILINNQLLSTANAKDINTGYYVTNGTLVSRYHGTVA